MLFAILALAATPAFAGTNSSGGGDSYAQEFTGIAQALAHSLDDSHSRSAERFLAVVAKMRVVTEEHVYFKGAEVDARNEPPHRLVHLNRTRWKEYSEQPHRKIALVNHEVYGLLGMTDQKYEQTGQRFSPEELAYKSSLKNVVLGSIDDHASDAWDESDAQYTFESLTCEKGKGCFLDVTARTHPNELYGQDVQKDVLAKDVQSRITHVHEIVEITKFRCHFDAFQQPVDMLDVAPVKGGKGMYIGLSAAGFDAVDTCIGQLDFPSLKLTVGAEK